MPKAPTVQFGNVISLDLIAFIITLETEALLLALAKSIYYTLP